MFDHLCAHVCTPLHIHTYIAYIYIGFEHVCLINSYPSPWPWNVGITVKCQGNKGKRRDRRVEDSSGPSQLSVEAKWGKLVGNACWWDMQDLPFRELTYPSQKNYFWVDDVPNFPRWDNMLVPRRGFKFPSWELRWWKFHLAVLVIWFSPVPKVGLLLVSRGLLLCIYIYILIICCIYIYITLLHWDFIMFELPWLGW